MTPAERVAAIADQRDRLLDVELLLLRGLVVGNAAAVDLHRRVIEQCDRLDGPWDD